MIQIIKQAAIEAVEQSSPTSIAYGTVTKTNPLEINVEQRLLISGDMILLTSLVIDKQTKISFDNPGIINIINGYLSSGTTKIDRLSFLEKIKNDITMYDGLKLGEKVLLLRVQGGQKYIVLDRLVSANDT